MTIVYIPNVIYFIITLCNYGFVFNFSIFNPTIIIFLILNNINVFSSSSSRPVSVTLYHVQ